MIKILTVDDEPSICKTIENIFSNIGFSVVTATDSTKAIKVFKKEKPKIIFLDIKMPDVDGFELLKEFKATDPDCIVFMVTAYDDEANKQKAIKLGASDFIKKPFSHNYLRDIVVGQIHNVLTKGGHMRVPKILIADDEQDTLELVKKKISGEFEAEIETVTDGLQAIEKAGSFKPDVILLDVSMPKMSGIDALPELKKAVPEAIIIIISAWSSVEVLTKASALGVTEYITKPYPPAALIEKVKSVLISIGKLIVKKKG